MVGKSKPFSKQSGRHIRILKKGKSVLHSSQVRVCRDYDTSDQVNERSAPGSSTSTQSPRLIGLNPAEHKAPKKKKDSFCWVCHEDTKNQENIFVCEKCPRVFHNDCLRLKYRPVIGKTCPACTVASVDGSSQSLVISKGNLCSVLKIAIDKIRNKWPDFERLDNHKDYGTFDVANPLDLLYLCDKVNCGGYMSTAALLEDAKWIHHRFHVICGPGNENTNNAKMMIEELRSELIKIESCPECYLGLSHNSKEFFKELCSRRHPLVWAKVKGYPYWPAKVLKVVNGKASLLFFGKHERATISLGPSSTACFSLSKEYPFEQKFNVLIAHRRFFKEANEELQAHIRKIIETCGSYKYAKVQTPFNPSSYTKEPEPENVRSEPLKKKRRVESQPQPCSNNWVDLCDDSNESQEIEIIGEVVTSQQCRPDQWIDNIKILNVSSMLREDITSSAASSEGNNPICSEEVQEELVFPENSEELNQDVSFKSSAVTLSAAHSDAQQTSKSIGTVSNNTDSSSALHVVCDADTTSSPLPNSEFAEPIRNDIAVNSLEQFEEQIISIVSAVMEEVLNEDTLISDVSKLCDRIKLPKGDDGDDAKALIGRSVEKLLKRTRNLWEEKHRKSNSRIHLEAAIKENESVIKGLESALKEQKESSLFEVNNLKTLLDSHRAAQKSAEDIVLRKDRLLQLKTEELHKLRQEMMDKDEMLSSTAQEVQKIREQLAEKEEVLQSRMKEIQEVSETSQQFQENLTLVEQEKDLLEKACREKDIETLLIELKVLVGVREEAEKTKEMIHELATSTLESVHQKASYNTSRVAGLVKQCELVINSQKGKESPDELKSQLKTARLELREEKRSKENMIRTYKEALREKEVEFTDKLQSKDVVIRRLMREIFVKQKSLLLQKNLRLVLASNTRKLQKQLKAKAQIHKPPICRPENREKNLPKSKKIQCDLLHEKLDQEMKKLEAIFGEKVSELDRLLDRESKAKITIAEELESQRKENEVQVKAIDKHVRSYIKTYFGIIDDWMEKFREKLNAREIQLMKLEKEFKNKMKAIKKKAWCHVCLEKAQFQCCYSTYYCSETCQALDFERHSYECEDDSKSGSTASLKSSSSSQECLVPKEVAEVSSLSLVPISPDMNSQYLSSVFLGDDSKTPNASIDFPGMGWLSLPNQIFSSPTSSSSQHSRSASRNCSTSSSSDTLGETNIHLVKV